MTTILALLWPSARFEDTSPRDDAPDTAPPVAPPPVPAPAPAPPVAPPPPGPPGRGDGLPAPIPEETLMGASLHHGRVVDEERRPLGDAPVRVFVGGKLVATPRTGADGGFTVPDIPWKYRRRAHLAIALVVRDGAGRAVRASARVTMGADTDEESEAMLPHLMVGNLVLREASPLAVLVRAGGRPVEGAEVHAEERDPGGSNTEVVRSDASGVARLEDLPHGEWFVHAGKPGLGAGQAVVEVPSPEGLAIDLDARTLEIEAVDAATGRPVEGVRFAVRTKYRHLDEERWHHPFPPLDPPPTDSSGRTRLADAGEAAIRLLPILAGRDGPDAGAVPADVEPGATFVRVPVAGTRTVRWPLLPGEAGTPPEGSRLVVGEERFARDPQFRFTQDETRRERIENGEVVVEGIGPGPFEALARAPDGSLARLSVEAGAAKGPPVRFFAPRRLSVVVRDEDGLPVAEPVALLTPRGDAVAMVLPAATDGKLLVEHLHPGEYAVCAMARHEWGGAEVARVDLSGGDRTLEAVVGRAFTVVLRFARAGRPGIPAGYELRLRTPGPAVHGKPHEEFVPDPEERPETGEVRFAVRPHAPGKPVALRISVPGRDPILREAAPPAEKGGETVVEIDL